MAQDPTPPLPPERLRSLAAIPLDALPSPAYVVHLDLLEANARTLARFARDAGCKILLAQKGFSCFATYPLLCRYLDGTTASGLHEALLAHEHFGGEVHVYSPAYKRAEIEHLRRFAHTIVFNSPRQTETFLPALENFSGEIGLRVNPEFAQSGVDLYNPCGPGSRLGMTRAALDAAQLDLARIDGLHFHALCEEDADALEGVIRAFEERFGDLLDGLQWVNFGGGHHFTRPGYDLERAARIIREFRARHGLAVYVEPGEAVALHTGILAVTVLDLLEANGVSNAILDTSATCHMPDVLEMPYRPGVLGGQDPGALAYTYRLGGLSCLAGDVIGDYSFVEPLELGQRLRFLDMAHYSMVKATTFNGVPLPTIALFSKANGLELVRRFGYGDYATRLS